VSETDTRIKALHARIAALEAERDGLAIIAKDLAMLVRRLCRHCAAPELVEKANDYLKRKNLQGSPLR
jgi:hypothetical protein